MIMNKQLETRIQEELTELYNTGNISSVDRLSKEIEDIIGTPFKLSGKKYPHYNAILVDKQTVFCHLNPGEEITEAIAQQFKREHIDSCSNKDEFIANYYKQAVEYAEKRFKLGKEVDNFDFKQSLFLSGFPENGIDFAFRLGPLSDSSLVSIPVAPKDYALVATPELVRSQNSLEHPSNLEDWPCIRSHIDGMLYPWTFTRENESFTFESDNHMLSNDLRVCTRLVLEGLGLAFLPMHLVHSYLEEGRLVSVLKDWCTSERIIHLVYINRSNLPSKSRAFIKFVRSNQNAFSEALNRG